MNSCFHRSGQSCRGRYRGKRRNLCRTNLRNTRRGHSLPLDRYGRAKLSSFSKNSAIQAGGADTQFTNSSRARSGWANRKAARATRKIIILPKPTQVMRPRLSTRWRSTPAASCCLGTKHSLKKTLAEIQFQCKKSHRINPVSILRAKTALKKGSVLGVARTSFLTPPAFQGSRLQDP